MRIRINPHFDSLRGFVERLPREFAREGSVLHDARNSIRAFEIGGDRYAVKKYKRPHPLNRFVYTFLRKSKAQRAYEHAQRLLGLGIGTPEPVGWLETRRHGLLQDAYFICRYTDYAALCEATLRFPAPDTLPLLTAFARFAAALHEKGVLHGDFNHSNILYRCDPVTGAYRFQLIDANRMKFRSRVGERASIVNLRRLSCPSGAYLYILNAYSEARNWNTDDTLLRGIVTRLLFRRRQRIKAELKRHRLRTRQKKRSRNLHS